MWLGEGKRVGNLVPYISIQDPVLNGIGVGPTSQICASTMLLQIARN